jgi:hypothetical protein
MMIAAKYRQANSELLRDGHKNERLYLFVGVFFMVVAGCSIAILLFMGFLVKLGLHF